MRLMCSTTKYYIIIELAMMLFRNRKRKRERRNIQIRTASTIPLRRSDMTYCKGVVMNSEIKIADMCLCGNICLFTVINTFEV